ncbi:MAG TPA: hypothetical protein VK837_10445 [Longimicrobiales bacterium]|nr:hypothetical protein [Longimicrobiales bacterium]
MICSSSTSRRRSNGPAVMLAVLAVAASASACASSGGGMETGDAAPAAASDGPPVSFFITSAGPGDGANLGGLEGADAHCQMLAEASGFGALTWHAYLSASAANGRPAVNARDRIGAGPWYNVEGVLIATDPADLHGESANLTKQTILTEKGAQVNGRGDTPNMHDIITGSQLDGTAFAGADDTTCSNWTSSAGDGSARVGHHDRQGGGDNPTSWNSAHNSRGCGQADLQGTGGNGFFYCFAVDAPRASDAAMRRGEGSRAR